MNSKPPSKKDQKEQATEVNCFSCAHFFITYDPDFAYGCRAVDFKSRLLPAKVMYIHSGIECQLFKDKPDKKSP
jgi:hypothetical protein